jgi:hypothetical protein
MAAIDSLSPTTADLIAKYTDCSVKHRLTVEAWKKALEAK